MNCKYELQETKINLK